MKTLLIFITLYANVFTFSGLEQAVSPLEQRFHIPIQPSGLSSPINNGELTDLGTNDLFANSDAARHAKEMSIDSMRMKKVGIFGRPSVKNFIKTSNRIMNTIHDAMDRTADYIHQVRTAKDKMIKLGESFKAGFTGMWETLKAFKVSDLWDYERKWSRQLEDDLLGLNFVVQDFVYTLNNAAATRDAFLNAYTNLYGNLKEDIHTHHTQYGMKYPTQAIYDDPEFKEFESIEHIAKRTLLNSKHITQLLDVKDESFYNKALAFAGKVTFNDEVANIDQATRIEVEIISLAVRLKNNTNSYSDVLVIKSELDKLLIKLDRMISGSEQDAALLKTAELKLLTRDQYKAAEEENTIYQTFGGIK